MKELIACCRPFHQETTRYTDLSLHWFFFERYQNVSFMPSIIKKSTYFTIHNGKFCGVKVGKKVKAMLVDNQRILKKKWEFLEHFRLSRWFSYKQRSWLEFLIKWFLTTNASEVIVKFYMHKVNNKSKVWNMFKVTKKDTRTTPMAN